MVFALEWVPYWYVFDLEWEMFWGRHFVKMISFWLWWGGAWASFPFGIIRCISEKKLVARSCFTLQPHLFTDVCLYLHLCLLRYCKTSWSCSSAAKTKSIHWGERWKDSVTDWPSLFWQTDIQLNKLPDLPLPAVHLFLLYRGEGPGPCPPLPSSLAPLVVNWAPARPRPFIASICQSLQAWIVRKTLYKWRAYSPLHLSLSLYPFITLSFP